MGGQIKENESDCIEQPKQTRDVINVQKYTSQSIMKREEL